MIATITGSKFVGSYINKADENVLTILGALDKMNDEKTHMQLRGYQDLAPFIEKKYGFNGEQEVFEYLKLYAIDDGEYADAPTFNEIYETWFYTRKGQKIKDYEFSLSLIEEAYEKDLDLKSIVDKRVKAIGEWYLLNYIPLTTYQTLLTIPNVQQSSSFRAAPIGLLRDTPVDRALLKPTAKHTIRNNYKAVKDAVAGITVDDLEQIIEEFTEFGNITDGNLVVYGTRGSIAKVRNMIAADVNVDIFNRTGKPATTMLGVQFVQNDMIPAGKLLMVDGNIRDGIVHYQSPKPDLRGLGIVKDVGNGFDKLETIQDFVGSYWKLLGEGKFVKNRAGFCWIDLNNSAKDADLNMADAGINELKATNGLYERQWKFKLV